MTERGAERTKLEFDDKMIEQITKPDPLGRLCDSMNPGYEILGSINCVFDEIQCRGLDANVNTQEYLHESAEIRYEATKSRPDRWSPENVDAYIRSKYGRYGPSIVRVKALPTNSCLIHNSPRIRMCNGPAVPAMW